MTATAAKSNALLAPMEFFLARSFARAVRLIAADTWTAPPVDRTPSPNVAPERAAAEALLDYLRGTLLWKCAGLSAEQLKQRSVPPSSMSLLGLVRHMAEVERVWFRTRVAGEDIGPIFCSDASPDGDFDAVDAADAEADFAMYQREVEAARAVLAARSLDDTFALTRPDATIDVRALVLHMIEEYARHCGHADPDPRVRRRGHWRMSRRSGRGGW
jgi:uncharacterized damage-inducible protein DinB